MTSAKPVFVFLAPKSNVKIRMPVRTIFVTQIPEAAFMFSKMERVMMEILALSTNFVKQASVYLENQKIGILFIRLGALTS